MARRTAAGAVRERLLDAADRLFYRDGVQAVGIDRVLAEDRRSAAGDIDAPVAPGIVFKAAERPPLARAAQDNRLPIEPTHRG